MKRRIKSFLIRARNKAINSFFGLKKSYKKILIPPQGLGDILYILLTLRNKKETNLYIIVKNDFYKQLCLFFPEVIKKVYIFKHLPSICNSYVVDTNVYITKNKYNNFLTIFEKKFHSKIDYSKKININMKRVIKYLKKRKIDAKKIVFFMPESNSAISINDYNYWIRYADYYKKHGYVPIFNSNKNYGNYKSILLNLNDTIALAKLCYKIISFRSGLTDVVAFFVDTPIVVIYPNNPLECAGSYIRNFNKDKNDRYMKFCSLKKINPSKDIIELLYRDENLYL